MVDGELEEQITYEPADGGQEATFTGFVGGPFVVPPLRYVQSARTCSRPPGCPWTSWISRRACTSSRTMATPGPEPTLRCAGGRMTRRVTTGDR